jgi:ABC-2 type transport system permease protein
MRILLNEFVKTYFKWRTYIGFIAILVVIPLVMLGMKLDGASIIRNLTRGLEKDFFLLGNLFNGYFVGYFIMNGLYVHIPFLVSLVAGDQLAGEATAGTFRILLIRPVSRTHILFAKYVTTLIYTASLVAFLAVLSIGLGVLLFGTGDLLVPGRTLVILPKGDVLARFSLAYGLSIWSMWCVASLAFLFSSFVENAIGPIISTMAVIIVSLIISNMPFDIFAAIKPYLFTTYFNVWTKALAQPIPWSEVGDAVLRLGAYSVGFCLVTWYIFARKDIVS